MFGFDATLTSLIFLLIALYFPLHHFYTWRGVLLVSFGVCLAIFLLLLLVLPRAVVAYAYIPITLAIVLSLAYEARQRLRR